MESYLSKVFTVGLIAFLLVFQVKAWATVESDLATYMKLFSRDYHPSISDIRDEYVGETEGVFWDLIICGQKGWDQNKCNDYYLKVVSPNESKVPSLYYKWLRTKVPLSPKIKILSITNIKSGEEIQIVRVELNNLKVKFIRRLVEDDRGHSGALSLTEIEGVSVNKMCKDYLEKHDPKNLYPYLRNP